MKIIKLNKDDKYIITEQDFPDKFHKIVFGAIYKIYELGAAVLARQVTAATNILSWLISSNTNEYMIFGGVVAQLRRAYYATNSKDDINIIGKLLGCSPYAIKYSRRDYGNNPDAVKACYAKALELEYQIKSGQITVNAALDALIYR